jgi:hypothetical protein
MAMACLVKTLKGNNMMRKTVVSGVLGLVSLISANLASAVSVTATPSIGTVSVGGTFTVSIDGADFPAVTGGGVQVSWDAGLTLLDLDITGNPFEVVTTSPPNVETDASLATNPFDINQTQLFGGALSASFHIATLQFQVDQQGTFNIGLAAAPLQWINQPVSGDPVAIDPQPDYFGTTVSTPTAVPLPGAVWLFGAGLVGVIGVARRRSLSAD